MSNTAARLAIFARRYELCRFRIVVTGIDMTGVAMAMQVRPGRDVPGEPLIALGTVTTQSAAGLKLENVSVVDGIPVSIISGRINKTTMDAMPYDGEVGDDTVLAYAMQWTEGGDTQTRVYGDFVVEASAFGSDNAPDDRPIGYGSPRRIAGSTGSAIHFGDRVVRVSVLGVEYIQGLIETVRAMVTAAKAEIDQTAADAATEIAAATTAAVDARDKSQAWAESPAPPIPGSKSAKTSAGESADSATQSRNSAVLSGYARDDARGWAEGPPPPGNGILVRSAHGWSDKAGQDAAYADSARAAIVDLLAGVSIEGAMLLQAIDRAVLKSFSGMPAGRQAWLAETGRVGAFEWKVGDYSAQVLADDREAIFIKANGVSASAGAWVRMLPSFTFLATWWGLTPDVADAQPIIQDALYSVPAGSTLVLPPFTMLFPQQAGQLYVPEGVRLTGHGNTSWLNYTGPNSGGLGFIQCHQNNNEIDHFRISWKNPRLGSGNAPAIIVTTRVGGTGEGPLFQQQNFDFHHLLIDNTALGIQIAEAVDDTGNVSSRNSRIRECEIHTSLQAVSIFLTDNCLIENPLFISDKTDGSVYAPVIRIPGSRNVTVSGGRVIGAGTSGGNIGVDITGGSSRSLQGSRFRRRNRDVSIIGVEFRDNAIGASISECEGLALVAGCRFINDIDGVAPAIGATVKFINDPDLPGRIDDARIEDNLFEGVAMGLAVTGPHRSVEFHRNTVIGNRNTSNSATVRNAIYNTMEGRAFRAIGNSFLMEGIADEFAMLLGTAPVGMMMEVWDNAFPETATALASYGTGFNSAGAYARTSPGGVLITGQTGNALDWGSNYRHPKGALERYRSGAPIPPPALPAPVAWTATKQTGIVEGPAGTFERTDGLTGYGPTAYSDPMAGDFEAIYRIPTHVNGIAVGIDPDGTDGRLGFTSIACSYESVDVGGGQQRGYAKVYANGNLLKDTGFWSPGGIERWQRKGGRLTLSRGGAVVLDTEAPTGPMRLQIAIAGPHSIEVLRVAPL